MAFRTKVKKYIQALEPQPTVPEIALATGMSKNTIRAWMQGHVERVDSDVVGKWLRYLELDGWKDVLEDDLYFQWSDEKFDPTDDSAVIE